MPTKEEINKFRLTPQLLNALLRELAFLPSVCVATKIKANNLKFEKELPNEKSEKLELKAEKSKAKEVTLEIQESSISISSLHSFALELPYFTLINLPFDSFEKGEEYLSLKENEEEFAIIEKESEKEKEFHICDTTKDSKSFENESSLPYIGEVIDYFAKSKLTGTVLIPMRMCRNFMLMPAFFGKNLLQREHIVLVEVNLDEKTIAVHDSQSKERYKIYPDHLKEIASDLGFKYVPDQDYHAYDIQEDELLCGYFVYNYAKALVQGKDCSQVRLTTTDVKSMPEFFAKFDHAKKYMEDTGNPIPEPKYNSK